MRIFPAHLRTRRRRPDVGLLLDVPALADAGPSRLADLAPHADRLRLPAGRTIARAGATARELVVVVSGQAARLSDDGRPALLPAGAEIGGTRSSSGGPTPPRSCPSLTSRWSSSTGPQCGGPTTKACFA